MRRRANVNEKGIGSGSFIDDIERGLAEQRIVNVVGQVDSTMSLELAARLNYLAGVNNKPINVFLNTFGGSVTDGLAIYDLIVALNKKVPINVVATGACMSMGTIILQAGRKRLTTPFTSFLLHELSMRNEGKLGELRDNQKEAERLQHILNGILAKRTRLSEKKLMQLFTRREFYIDAEEARKYRLVDGIIGEEPKKAVKGEKAEETQA